MKPYLCMDCCGNCRIGQSGINGLMNLEILNAGSNNKITDVIYLKNIKLKK